MLVEGAVGKRFWSCVIVRGNVGVVKGTLIVMAVLSKIFKADVYNDLFHISDNTNKSSTFFIAFDHVYGRLLMSLMWHQMNDYFQS